MELNIIKFPKELLPHEIQISSQIYEDNFSPNKSSTKISFADLDIPSGSGEKVLRHQQCQTYANVPNDKFNSSYAKYGIWYILFKFNMKS